MKNLILRQPNIILDAVCLKKNTLSNVLFFPKKEVAKFLILLSEFRKDTLEINLRFLTI
jgi:hypothetical protein